MSITQTRLTKEEVQLMDSSTTVAASLSGTTANFGTEEVPKNLHFLEIDGYNNSSQGSNKYSGIQLDGGRLNETPTMRLISESEQITSGKRTAQFALGDLTNDVDGAFTVAYQETVEDQDADTDAVPESLTVTLAAPDNTLTIHQNASNGGGNLILSNGTITNPSGLTLANGSITDSSGEISFGNEKLSTTGTIACATPTDSGHAATKSYVDSVAQGLDVKKSVRLATTGKKTMASDFENGKFIDGVELSTGDRILIKDQSDDASENGIYVVAASGAPARAEDSITAGAFTFVEEGTANADKGFVLTTNDPITVGNTNLTFTQFSSVGAVTLSSLDVTATASELNIMNGETSATSITLADTDRVVVNDGGTMAQVALTDFETYFESALDTLSNVTTVGALDAGSITSNFGSINIGSSTLTAGTNSTIGTLTLADGSITDSGNNISFGTNNLTTSGTITADSCNCTSDARLKENVVEMTGAVAKVQRLRGVDFTWKDSGKADAGVIAQEVEAVAPHWVAENAEGTKAVDYGKLSALLIQAVKEQQATIDELRRDVAALQRDASA